MLELNFSSSYQFGDDTVTKSGHVRILNHEFVPGQSEYTMTVRCDYNGSIQTITYKYEAMDEDGIPAGYVCGPSPAYLCMYGRPPLQLEAHFEVHMSSNSRFISVNSVGTGNVLQNFTMNGFWGYSAMSADNDTCDITIEADFPLFLEGSNVITTNETQVKIKPLDTNYLPEIASGDYTHIDQAINYMNSVDSIPHNQVWSIQNFLKVDGTLSTSKAYSFKILPTAKIAMYVTERLNGDSTPNAHILISEYPCEVKAYSAPDSAYTETYSIDSDYWWGEWQDYGDGTSYNGYGSTNIPIYRSATEVQQYFDGVIGIEDSINGGNTSIKTSSIGEELTASYIPTISLATSGIGSFAYALSATQLTEIMEDYLYTDDTTLQDTMKDALWAWGNNPIDFLIDCYYVPFSITHFYDTINANLKFGSYQFPNTSYPAIKETNGNRLVLFNTTFEGVYGDWRDFTQFNYDLFLPFIGFVPLDVQKYLNKQVRCEMMFDISTHNLRYYLFVDDKITDRFDGSVGINIPLMATDIVNKAKHDRDIKYGLVSDALSAGTQIGMGVTSADFGGMATGLVGGINTIVNGVKKYQELNNRASSGVNGSFSSSMNVYDISYAYLRITERQMILPSELNSVYNFPSYYIGTLSNLSGYCEIDDIQLKSNCTESEYNEIKTILKGGVIF